MDQNLTRYLNIVGASTSGFVPKPGYDLVVLKRAQAGLQFDRVTPDGEAVEQGRWISRIFKNDQNFVCYSVNRDPHLVHSFSTQVEHAGHCHSFRLDYTLMFAIIDPRVIVERLNDDPVRKIEIMVGGSVDADAKKLPWQELSNDVLDFAGEHLTGKILHDRFPTLTAVAKQYGIDLQSVSLAWHLGADDIADIQARIKGKTKKELAAINADTAETELVSQHKINVLKAHQESEINAIKRTEQLYDVALQKFDLALGNVADKVNSPEALRHVYEVVRETAAVRGQSPALPQHKISALPSAGSSDDAAAITGVIQEALSQCSTMPVSQSDKRQLLGYVLHCIADCYMTSPSEERDLDGCTSQVKMIVQKADRPLSTEQWSYFRRILDSDSLKSQLRD